MEQRIHELNKRIEELEKENAQLRADLVKSTMFNPLEKDTAVRETAENILESVEYLLTKYTEAQHYRGEHFVPTTINIGFIKDFESLKEITLKCVNTNIRI